jgi:hypothetical protein
MNTETYKANLASVYAEVGLDVVILGNYAAGSAESLVATAVQSGESCDRILEIIIEITNALECFLLERGVESFGVIDIVRMANKRLLDILLRYEK